MIYNVKMSEVFNGFTFTNITINIKEETMSYIIVHVDNPEELRTMEAMSEGRGQSVKRFKTKTEAFKFLDEIGLETDLWYNSDIHVLRLH